MKGKKLNFISEMIITEIIILSIDLHLLMYPREGRGGLEVRPRLRAGGPQVRNPFPPKIRRVWGPLHAKSYVVAKRPSAGVAWKFGERAPVQVSSSSSDRGSKIRGPNQNSPRVVSNGT
ncbi:hypothetical protein AVEN_173079-1 [Araneus ventricosus]|uniref:Uncharacterized protein n=1 Tax=Araneus ventricosus TaxID=182803 RepID=A0A4Y2HE51_ARAVE|nr:hypothetical protein AVEN_173079-1 [Araneus ventricosus]